MLSREAMKASPVLLLCLAVSLIFTGCGDKKTTQPYTPPPSTPTTGTITGLVSLPPGLPGDLGNARVALYTSIDNFNSDTPARPFSRVVGSGPSVSIMETGITPGSYFVEVWQDTDHTGSFTTGDWWGISGTSTWPNPVPSMVMVSAGGTQSVAIYLIAIP